MIVALVVCLAYALNVVCSLSFTLSIVFFEGLFGQHTAKKPKMMKQSLDNTFDNISPMTGSIPSPVASQMSNMSNTNKFMKLIGGRDRGRKTKALKVFKMA